MRDYKRPPPRIMTVTPPTSSPSADVNERCAAVIAPGLRPGFGILTTNWFIVTYLANSRRWANSSRKSRGLALPEAIALNALSILALRRFCSLIVGALPLEIMTNLALAGFHHEFRLARDLLQADIAESRCKPASGDELVLG